VDPLLNRKSRTQYYRIAYKEKRRLSKDQLPGDYLLIVLFIEVDCEKAGTRS